jgi:hypothetical protein
MSFNSCKKTPMESFLNDLKESLVEKHNELKENE